MNPIILLSVNSRAGLGFLALVRQLLWEKDKLWIQFRLEIVIVSHPASVEDFVKSIQYMFAQLALQRNTIENIVTIFSWMESTRFA